MAKRKSTRETKNMIQTALWLPRGMHEKLKKAGGDRGLGDEIRRRLVLSYAAEETASDQTTYDLLVMIKEIAHNLSFDETWHTNRFNFDVFKVAIDTLLSLYQPSGEAQPETKAKLQKSFGHEDPEVIGRIMAHLAVHVPASRPSTLPVSFLNE